MALEQNNFSFGLSRIKSEEVIAALSKLRPKTRMEVRSKARAKTQLPSPKLPVRTHGQRFVPAGAGESETEMSVSARYAPVFGALA